MKTKINQAAPTGTREPWESEADRRGVRYWMELLFKSPVGTVGFIIIVLVILSSLLAGVISPYDPAKIFLCQVGTKKFLRFYKPFIGGRPPVNGL